MSKIKSALELALERMADVTVDRDAVRREESIKKGKGLAGHYLRDPKSISLTDELSKLDADESEWSREGLIESLLANLTLPRYETDINTLPVIAEALGDLGARRGPESKTLEYMMNQYGELFKQYLENLDQLEEQIKVQWEPRLKQKEQQLRERTGQKVKLTPEQDPDYARALSEQLSRLDVKYGEVLAQGKAEIRKILGLK